MFGTTRKGPDKVQGQEPIIEMNLGIIATIGGTLRGITTHLKTNIVTDLEKRELEFDRDRRHEELVQAFLSLATRMGGETPNPKPEDKKSRVENLMKWVGRVFGLGFTAFRVFFKKFLKFMKLSKLWPFLRVAGLIVSRLFLPLTIIGAAIWAIPKIIDAWPGIKTMIQNVVSGIWSAIKSFLGFGDDDEDAVAEHMESAEGPPIYYWDSEAGNWVIANTAIPGVPQAREDVIKKLVPFVIGNNFTPEFLGPLINSYMGQRVAAVPETPMIGDSAFLATPGAAFMAGDEGLDPNLVALIAEQEGFREEAYQDPAGNWTVGYGHTGDDVGPGTTMSRAQAASTLVQDVKAAEGRAAQSMDNKFGEGTFQAMPRAHRALATDVAFNVGSITAMPQLMNAMGTGDHGAVLAQMNRHYTTPSGAKMPLTRRNEAFRQLLTSPGPQASVSSTPMATTPSTTVPGEDPPEIITIPNETHATSTVPVVAKTSSKTTSNQQTFFSDAHYGHLGLT